MSYTINDLHTAICRWYNKDCDYSDEPGSEAWHAFRDALDDRHTAGLDLPNIGTVRLADDYGGEGKGESYYFIFAITDNKGAERMFKRDGWWQSHNGGYYEGPTTEVHAVKKIVTVYEDAAA